MTNGKIQQRIDAIKWMDGGELREFFTALAVHIHQKTSLPVNDIVADLVTDLAFGDHGFNEHSGLDIRALADRVTELY